jgi:hypothetical protein
VLVWWLSRINSDCASAAQAYAQRVLATAETLETNLANLSNSDGLGSRKFTHYKERLD